MNRSNRLGSWTLLILLGTVLLLIILGTVDTILFRVSSVETSADILKVDVLENGKYDISYSYYNNFTQREYILNTNLEKKQFLKIQGKNNLQIKYIGYFPKSPLLTEIESENSMILLMIGLVAISLSFYRTLLVVQGKLEISQFLGSRGNDRQ